MQWVVDEVYNYFTSENLFSNRADHKICLLLSACLSVSTYLSVSQHVCHSLSLSVCLSCIESGVQGQCGVAGGAVPGWL